MKKCSKCKKLKPINDFYKRGGKEKGLRSHCCSCCSERRAEWRLKNSEHDSLTHRKWRMGNLSKRAAYLRQYRLNNPEKFKDYQSPEKSKARVLARETFINKVAVCEVCGKAFAKHRHHKDYSRPLDIIWVCVSCHQKIHSKQRKLRLCNG